MKWGPDQVKSGARCYIALIASSSWLLRLSTSPCRSGRCLREDALFVEMPTRRRRPMRCPDQVKSTTRNYFALLASSTWPLTLSTSPCRSGRCLREHALIVEMPSGRLLCNHRRRTSPLPSKKRNIWGISAAAFLTRFRPYPCHGPPSATLQIPCPEPGRKRAPIDAPPPARKA